MNEIEVRCSVCDGSFMRTRKQVNQAVKLKGAWQCVSCARARRMLDLKGQRFGRLLVTGRAPSKLQKSRFVCLCDCGQTAVAYGSYLARGKTLSCGCLSVETRGQRTVTHGMTKSRTYRIWQAMLTRCNNERSNNYANYGGRGIEVCSDWKTFDNFLRDMGECPDGLSIERVDVNGNYSPENCIWADRKQQARNTRANRFITLDGETKCLKAWAEDLDIDQASLRERLDKWPLREALTTPKGVRT